MYFLFPIIAIILNIAIVPVVVVVVVELIDSLTRAPTLPSCLVLSWRIIIRISLLYERCLSTSEQGASMQLVRVRVRFSAPTDT